MNFQKLPKVELHLHLDCSLSYDVVARIDPSISQEEYRQKFIAPPKCEDLRDFLSRAPSSFPLMQTEEHLQLVVFDLFEQLRKDGVIYAELRFAPLLHTEGGLTPRQVVASVEAATAQAVRDTGVEARVILCTLRFYSAEQSLETVKLVEDFANTYIAGFDVAADTPGNVIDAHLPAFQYARENNIPYTAHAGETRGIENVWDTVRSFTPSRIGHGVCSIEDPALLEHIQQHNIHLEACPSCNVQTDCYDTYADHPVDRLLRAGISVSVSTDTRTICDNTLTQEYEKLNRVFGWGREQFLQSNINAVRAAFIPEQTQNDLISRLEEAYQ